MSTIPHEHGGLVARVNKLYVLDDHNFRAINEIDSRVDALEAGADHAHEYEHAHGHLSPVVEAIEESGVGVGSGVIPGDGADVLAGRYIGPGSYRIDVAYTWDGSNHTASYGTVWYSAVDAGTQAVTHAVHLEFAGSSRATQTASKTFEVHDHVTPAVADTGTLYEGELRVYVFLPAAYSWTVTITPLPPAP